MSRDKYFSSIEEFKEAKPAKKMMMTALKEILPTKENRFGFFVSLALGVIFAIIVGTSSETINMLKMLSDKLLGTLLAIFACIFAVYSILLAFLNDGYIKRLSTINYDAKTSYLKKSTTYYESVLFLYFIGIGIAQIVLLLLSCMPEDFTLTLSHSFNTCTAIVLIWLYLSFIFRVLYELKSTIYNTIILFRASMAYKLIDFEKEEAVKSSDSE